MGATARKAHGYLRVFGPGGVLIREADSIRCVHCDLHWIVDPGSGRKRGWCLNCGGPHCGGKNCWSCTPFQKKLDEAMQRARLSQSLGLEG